MFCPSLEMIDFQGSAEGVRPSVKHRTKISGWPGPNNRAELDALLWLTPFSGYSAFLTTRNYYDTFCKLVSTTETRIILA